MSSWPVKNKVEIPEPIKYALTKRATTTLIVVAGLPGLGKSTMCGAIADLHERVHHLKGDDIWPLVCPQGFKGNMVPLGYKLMELLVKAL